MKQRPDTTAFTILTGFLGAGKTTLLNRLLSTDHGSRLAVIVNEFGAINIDGALIADNIGDGVVEMTNGCVCCTVREDLRQGLQNLLEQRRGAQLSFDHIVMETTGLAKVGPIVETLCSRDFKSELVLGGVVTVVDAFHAPEQLENHEEVAEQIGMADLILLNKIDLVDDAAREQLRFRIAAMNRGARIVLCQDADIDVADIVTLHAKQPNKFGAPNIRKASLNETDGHDHNHHHHLDSITSFVISIEAPLDHGLVQDWFSYFIMRYSERLLRYKGHLNIKGRSSRLVVQGIHSFIEVTPGRDWQPDEVPKTELVFIGKNLPQDDIDRGLTACIAD